MNELYWSVRRELWENRSIYLAPLIVAAVVLFSTFIITLGLPSRVRDAGGDAAKQRAAIARPFKVAPAPIMLTTFIVGFFYCLDALYGERRDRSILFWKSLPVSDRTTVLSKASIPLIVLPGIALVLSVIVQLALLFLGTMIFIGNGMSPARLWGAVRFVPNVLIMIYGLTVHVLWFAPIYALLLLISAWARRAPVLWFAVPLLIIGAVERIVFSASHVSMLQYRLAGAMSAAFDNPDGHYDRLSQLSPLRFMTTPGLWFGLLLAAVFLLLAVRLRRNREPI